MDTMNESYNKETIDAKFEGINTKLDDQSEVLGSIERKVTATNGSVAAVTQKQANQAGYNTAISIVGGILVTALFGSLGYIFIQFVNLKVQVAAVKQAQTQTSATISEGVQQGLENWADDYNKTVIK